MRNQLLKIASVYRRPFTTFYLDNPPMQGEPDEDFRSLPAHVPALQAAMLDTLLRDIRARQEMVLSLLEDDEETRPLPFVASFSIADGATTVAHRIATALGYAGVGRAELLRPAEPDEFFRNFRTRAEHAESSSS